MAYALKYVITKKLWYYGQKEKVPKFSFIYLFGGTLILKSEVINS